MTDNQSEQLNYMSLSEEHKWVNEYNAEDLLTAAAETIKQRATEKDLAKERSMKKAIDSFNQEWGTELTEEQGWNFMVHLKRARAKGAKLNPDDYIDMISYTALQAECRLNQGK